MSKPDCDVLIVGGGPTGITLALIASAYGASVIVCEKEAGIYPLPRAAHVDHEVMRIFQSVGAADQIAKTCRTTSRYEFRNAAGDILLQFDNSDQIGAGGWPAANMIHQPSLERALREHLPESDCVELRSRWSFSEFVETEELVTATFNTPGGAQTLTSRFLVGADGARSPVRTAAGIPVDDLEFDEPWLVIDTIVHDFERLPPANLQICDPARPTTCVLMGEGRHRWEFMILPDETPDEVLEDDFIETLLRPWNVDGAVSLERKAVYRFNARVAKSWRRGRVLLAGDAAHQTPPFAGQGLCAGSRDAANLGWKLGMISTGNLPDAILDTYQQEREPHVRATIQMAIMMGRTVCTIDPLVAAERDRQMLAARANGQSPDGQTRYPDMTDGLILQGSPGAGEYFPQFSAAEGSAFLDGTLGPGAWLIGTGNLPTIPGGRSVDLDAEEMAAFAAPIRAWLTARNAVAVLVRPDRYAFGAGAPEMLAKEWCNSFHSVPGRAAEVQAATHTN